MTCKSIYVQALYDFLTDDLNELSFQRGDLLQVVHQIDEHWYNGILLIQTDQQQGNFPINYVKTIDIPQECNNATIFIAKADFPFIEKGDLNFKIGEIIVGQKKIDENWYFGNYLFDKTKEGIFPLTHVNRVYLHQSKKQLRDFQMFENCELDDKLIINDDVDNCLLNDKTLYGMRNLFPRNCVNLNDENIKFLKSKSVECLPTNEIKIIEQRKYSLKETAQEQKVYAQTDTIQYDPDYYRVVKDYISSDQKYLSCVMNELLEGLPTFEKTQTDCKNLRNLNSQTGLVPIDHLQKLNLYERELVRGKFKFKNSIQNLHVKLESFKELLDEKLPRQKQSSHKENGKELQSEIDSMLFLKESVIQSANSKKLEVRPVPAVPRKPIVVNLIKDTNQKNLENRQHIIKEMLTTEMAFNTELSSLLTALTDYDDPNRPTHLNTEYLFGNLSNILKASSSFIDLLNQEIRKDEQNIRIGYCLNECVNSFKDSYAVYCKNYPNIYTTLKKYENDIDLQNYMIKKTESIRYTGYVSLSMSLIKPVQRITKYSLFIDQLLKNTHESHPDFDHLNEASKVYTELLQFINEYKRRQEVISKYFNRDDKRLVSIAIPKIRKKSDRIRVRLTTLLGLHDPKIDVKYNIVEEGFRCVERNLKYFLVDSKAFVSSWKVLFENRLAILYNMADLYQEETTIYERVNQIAVKFLEFQSFYANLESQINQNIWIPIQTCLDSYEMPNILIRKRFDKLTDYEAELDRYEEYSSCMIKPGHPLHKAENIYKAINEQLLEDLPKLTQKSTNILNLCLKRLFGLLRDSFAQLKEQKDFVILPIVNDLDKSSRDALIQSTEDFFKKYDIRRGSNEIGTTSFIFTSYIEPNDVFSSTNQTQYNKDYLQQKYPSDKLFDVVCNFDGNDKICQLSVAKGDLVGLIKPYDLSGDKTIWLVDNGQQKGFVPASILNPSNVKNPIDLMMSPNPESCICLYDFNSIHATTLTIREGEVLLVLEKQDKTGSKEWFLVQNSNALSGYVPANYVFLLQ